MPTVDRFTCEQVFLRLDEYIDRELTADEMQLIHEHIAQCHWCLSAYEFQESVLSSVKAKLQRVQAPPDLMERISLALKQETAKESGI